MRRCGVALLVIGVLGLSLAVVGVVLVSASVLTNYIHHKVEEDVALVNGSASFNAWLDPPAPVFMEFRVFSIVNPQEVLTNGTKPVVIELGPYTYREIRPKLNVTFHQNGSRISYVQPKSYVFVPEKSHGSPNDNVTTINFPILTAAYQLEYYSAVIKFLVKQILNAEKEELFMTRTVAEILFGYEERTFKLLNKVLPKSYQLPTLVGLFAGPTGNGTNDGEYEVCSGINNPTELGQIMAWQGQSSVTFWNDKYGNEINGTDGSLWHPFVAQDEKLYIFSSDVCRSIYATYNRTVHVDGIVLYRFVVPKEVLASAQANPDNAAFCTPDCLDTGVINITACKEGAPVVMSLPHFLNAAPQYIKAIGGMRPEAEKHETQLDVEPITGAVLHAAKRLQFNFYVKPLDLLKGSEKMKDVIYPLLWVTETAALNSSLAEDFKKMVYLPMEEAAAAQYGLIGVGLALVFIAAVVVVVRRCRHNGPGLSVQCVEPLVTA